MADTFSKKERQKKKAKKKLDKLERREERKQNNNKGKSFEEMLAYVDEFGNTTDVPPEKQNRSNIKLEDIQLGAAPIIEVEKKEITGVVKSFSNEKAYGFILEDVTKETVFVHANNLLESIKEYDRVTYEKERTPKGFVALQVKKIK
ncbi:MAG: cold shock domain-containing protein [Chitinophagales bacterium]|nr:cold shock domain-containing protein [Chitinophagales bacterium]